MTDGDKRNVRLLQVAHRLSAKGYGSAQRTTDALARIKTELDYLDGWASGGAGDGENTQPEAFMLRRYHWTGAKEDLRDAILNVELAVRHHAQVCQSILGIDQVDVPLCNGKGYEGSDVPWTPYSRDPDNGWYDPLCANGANSSGVCNGCQIRERRWRMAHGFKPRSGTLADDAA